MLKRINTLVLGLFLAVGLTSYASSSLEIAKDWKRIGTKKVNYKLDRDVMKVGVEDGRFNSLKLVVTGGALNMHKMIVHYGNGTKEEIELRHKFSKLSTSRVIDIRGNNRFIKQINFIYDTRDASNKKAKIHVFGK